MKKFLSTGICVLLIIAMLAGCSCERGDIDPTEATEEITEAATGEDEVLLPIEQGLDMVYSSGAGAWRTNLFLNADGSFTGDYHDSEMGLTGEDYDMTVVESSFKGNFTGIKKIEDYAYSMKLDKVETIMPAGEEEFEHWGDGTTVRILYEEAFGIEGGEEFILYLPAAPVEELDEAFSWWNPARGDEGELLGRYGLYNINEGAAFFTYD